MNRFHCCLLALVALCIHGQATAESHETCLAYARDAVLAFEDVRRGGCGFEGPRWQGNHRAHYEWCRGAPAAWVDNESRFRANQLRVCRREPEAQRCSRYASIAVAAQQFNLERRCGFEGARWGDSHDHHLAWCLSAPADVADRETAIRNAQVGVCNGNAEHRRCDAYARSAEAQVREARERGCGFGGARWTPLYEDHLTWCFTQPAAVAAQETREREGPLSQCRTQLPRGPAPEACNWTANVITDACTNLDGTPSDASGTANTGCGATREAAIDRAKAGLPVLLSDEDPATPGTCGYEVDARPGCGCG